MNAEFYLISGAIGCVGTLGGLAIGYYKSKGELPNLIDTKIKTHSETCNMRKETTNIVANMKILTEDLKKGTEIFTAIKIDMAVIKVKLGVKSDIAELRNAIATLEKKRFKDD